MSTVDGSIISALEKLDPEEAAVLEEELFGGQEDEENDEFEGEYVFEFGE